MIGALRRLAIWLFGGDAKPAPRAPLLLKSRLPGPITKMFERELAQGIGEDDTVRVSFENTTLNMDDADRALLSDACRRDTE